MKKWYETQGPEQRAVISSCVRISRNLPGIPFPAGLDRDGKKSVVQKLCEAVFSVNSSLSHKFRLIDLAELKTAELLPSAVLFKRISQTTGKGAALSFQKTNPKLS